VSLEGLSEGLTLQVPQPHRVVPTARSDRLTIGAKGDGRDRRCVSQQKIFLFNALNGCQQPRPHRIQHLFSHLLRLFTRLAHRLNCQHHAIYCPTSWQHIQNHSSFFA